MADSWIVVQIGSGRIGNLGMARNSSGRFVKLHTIIASTTEEMEFIEEEFETAPAKRYTRSGVPLLVQLVFILVIQAVAGVIALHKALTIHVLNIKSSDVKDCILHILDNEEYMTRCYTRRFSHA